MTTRSERRRTRKFTPGTLIAYSDSHRADRGARAIAFERIPAPLVYVNVVARNGEPWAKLGVTYIKNRGGTFAAIDSRVS